MQFRLVAMARHRNCRAVTAPEVDVQVSISVACNSAVIPVGRNACLASTYPDVLSDLGGLREVLHFGQLSLSEVELAHRRPPFRVDIDQMGVAALNHLKGLDDDVDFVSQRRASEIFIFAASVLGAFPFCHSLPVCLQNSELCSSRRCDDFTRETPVLAVDDNVGDARVLGTLHPVVTEIDSRRKTRLDELVGASGEDLVR